MSDYVYSPSLNLFYENTLKVMYEKNGIWPLDGVDIDVNTFLEYSSTPQVGKVRIADENGMPAWGEVPAPTFEQLVEAAEQERQQLIIAANAYINSQQWPSKLALERLSNDDKVSFNQWLDYLDELEAVDTSTAPDITWAQPPAL
ncbi:tail fiber assembly protein [Enterobacter kobei]|uniref:tail fiber assembly protein n=1 Tax=Enterobacter kobei TaxID=208224 RepID=UPI001C9DFDEE|nr:tail fiber assembly protein [Escherichia coli]QZS47695.1 tail fiber assembly protein [Enterobacter cloacae complex sp.]